MDNTMTPSQKMMTDGQIQELFNKFRDAARKHHDELSSQDVQAALRINYLGMVLFAQFRQFVETMMGRKIFTRNVFGVDRSQSPKEAINATYREEQYINQSVLDTMPCGEGENVTLKFFDLDYTPTKKQLDLEYRIRNLKTDPFALAKHMKDNPEFADECSVACQWGLDENGEISYLVFRMMEGVQDVCVGRSRACGYHRFAGVCK